MSGESCSWNFLTFNNNCSMMLVPLLILCSAFTVKNERVYSERINESDPSVFRNYSDFTNSTIYNSQSIGFLINPNSRVENGSRDQNTPGIYYDGSDTMDGPNNRITQLANNKYDQSLKEYDSNTTLRNYDRVDTSNQSNSDIQKLNKSNMTTEIAKYVNSDSQIENQLHPLRYCGLHSDKEELEEDEIPEDDYEKSPGLFGNDVRKIVRDIENISKYLERNNLDDLLSLPRVDLKHCVFGKSNDSVVCEYIGIACDYRPFISYDFFVRFILFFEVLKDEKAINYTHLEFHENKNADCEQKQCLVKLSKIRMEKVYGSYSWHNASKTFLGPTFMIYILGVVDKIEWEMDFNAHVAVGILQPDVGCSEEQRRSSTRTGRRSVSFINFPKIAAYRDLGYRDEFWDAFRTLTVRTLGGRNASLKMLFSSAQIIRFDIYLARLLNATGLSNLTINNFNLSGVTTIYDDMNDLKHLDLSNNYITHFDAENVKQSPNIESLTLSFNKLVTIPEEINSLHQLRYLDLSNNPIGAFHIQSSVVLHNLKNLKWLHLSHVYVNNLENLHALLGNSSVLLQGLDIGYCNLSITEDSDFFQEQYLLESINLAGNNLSALGSELFHNSKNLKYLNMSNSRLRTGPKLKFNVNVTLENLDLSYNQLMSPVNVLTSGKIRVLDLSYNFITNWTDEDIFLINSTDCGTKCYTIEFPKVWLQKLNLSYNQMKTVTRNMMKSMSFLNSVDLGGNQFDCSDCNSLEFGSLLRNIEENGTLEIHSLNLENELFCGRKGSSNPIPIKNVTSLPADCTPSDDWVTLGSVLGTILLLIVVVIGVFSFYKFEVAYLIFLLRQKRKANSTGETNDYEFDAFVCYSRSDRAWVIQEMVPTLEEAEEKFRLCLHERDFILGSFITLNVILSMQKSRYTILVLSNSFIQSQWCRWEMEMANHKLFESGREFLILLELQRLDPDTLPRHLKFLMDTRTYLEWPEPNSDSSTVWKWLKKNLGKSIHQQQLEKHQQAFLCIKDCGR